MLHTLFFQTDSWLVLPCSVEGFITQKRFCGAWTWVCHWWLRPASGSRKHGDFFLRDSSKHGDFFALQHSFKHGENVCYIPLVKTWGKMFVYTILPNMEKMFVLHHSSKYCENVCFIPLVHTWRKFFFYTTRPNMEKIFVLYHLSKHEENFSLHHSSKHGENVCFAVLHRL